MTAARTTGALACVTVTTCGNSTSVTPPLSRKTNPLTVTYLEDPSRLAAGLFPCPRKDSMTNPIEALVLQALREEAASRAAANAGNGPDPATEFAAFFNQHINDLENM